MCMRPLTHAYCCVCAGPCSFLHVRLQGLFKRITSLSYLGDVRMGLAEDSRKVERIVTGSYAHFRDTYLPLLQVGRGARGEGGGCGSLGKDAATSCKAACRLCKGW